MGWIQPDGTPIRFSPTHWKRDLAPVPDDETEQIPDDETEQIPDDETEQIRKRPLGRLILALVAAIVCIGGSFWIASKGSSSIDSAAHLERGKLSRERDQASLAIGDLAAARDRENAPQEKQIELKQSLDESEKRALALEHENVAQTQTAVAKQTELKQALDESGARSEALARELASARKNDAAARDLAAAREREMPHRRNRWN